MQEYCFLHWWGWAHKCHPGSYCVSRENRIIWRTMEDPNQSHEETTQKSSKYLASDWNKHASLRGSRLSYCTALRSFPHGLWLSLAFSSRSHDSFLVPEPSFQAQPASKDLFALWLFSVLDRSFPRKLFSMEPQKKGRSALVPSKWM